MIDFKKVVPKICYARGQEVATVMNGWWPGDQVIRWDASGLPVGIYYYRLAVSGRR